MAKTVTDPDPEKFANSFISGTDGETPPGGTPLGETPPKETPPGETPPGETPPVETPPSVELDGYWKQVSEQYKDVDGFTLPEEITTGKDKDGKEITPARSYELLQETIGSQTNPLDSVTDPFMRNYIEASSKEGFNRKEFFDSEMRVSNLESLPAADFLKEVYKQQSENDKLEWTPEMIEEHVKKMNPIEQQEKASQFKAKIRERHAAEINATTAKNEQELETVHLPKIQEENKKEVDLFIKQIENKKTVGGFRFDDEAHKTLLTELPVFLEKKIVEINGRKEIISPAEQVLEGIMASPENSLNFATYLYLYSKGKLDGYSSDLLEGNKGKIIKTLDREPEVQSGTSAVTEFEDKSFRKG